MNVVLPIRRAKLRNAANNLVKIALKFVYIKKSAAKALLRRTCNRMLICYQTALKLISNPLTEWVSAPTEMKSTPHSA